MESVPDMFGRTHPDCDACGADRAASSARSQTQELSVDGQCQLQPTSFTDIGIPL